MGNLGAQKAKRNDTPISAKKDIMGDKTVRVRADLHHIIKIETAKNGGNVKEVMDKALEEYIRKYLPGEFAEVGDVFDVSHITLDIRIDVVRIIIGWRNTFIVQTRIAPVKQFRICGFRKDTTVFHLLP